MNQIIQKIKKHQVSIERNRKVYAVLLPIIQQEDQWHILYEVRSQYISSPGQTSFPGGMVEEGETPQQAAIRETMEELGLLEEDIHVIGQLDPLIDHGRIIYCFVGHITLSDLKELSLNGYEVERVFTLSIDELIDQPPNQYAITYKPMADQQFPFKAIGLASDHQLKTFKAHLPIYPTQESLWGLTAQFTEQFISILTKEES